MDDVLVGFGVALLVENVPAQGFEEGIEKFLAELGLVVMTGAVGRQVVFEALDELVDDGRRGMGEPFKRADPL